MKEKVLVVAPTTASRFINKMVVYVWLCLSTQYS